MKRFISIGLLLLTVGTSGCQPNPSASAPAQVSGAPRSPSNRYAGTWALNTTSVQSNADAESKKAGKPPTKIALSASLVIKDDGEWTMTVFEQGHSFLTQGRAVTSSPQITLVPTMVNGEPPKPESEPKPAVLELSADGTKLSGLGQDSKGMEFDKK